MSANITAFSQSTTEISWVHNCSASATTTWQRAGTDSPGLLGFRCRSHAQAPADVTRNIPDGCSAHIPIRMMGASRGWLVLVITSQAAASTAERYWCGIAADSTCTSWVQLPDVTFATAEEMRRAIWVDGNKISNFMDIAILLYILVCSITLSVLFCCKRNFLVNYVALE